MVTFFFNTISIYADVKEISYAGTNFFFQDEERPSGYESDEDSGLDQIEGQVQWLNDDDALNDTSNQDKPDWKNYIDLESGGF